jgi:transglutaminase-like putative cysteine protease
VYIAGKKVGHIHVRVKPVKDKGKPYLNVIVDMELSFKRGADTSTIQIQYGTIETLDGQILRLDTRTLASQQILRVHGDVVGGKMTLKIENGDQRQEQVIPWSDDVMGPYGPELSFSRNPPKPGEIRTVKTFIPELNKIGVATLTCRNLELVPLGGGTNRELLRVDQEVSLEDGKKLPEMSQLFWVDSGGQVLKTYNGNFGGMVTYRTTREAARRESERFDLLDSTIVKLGRKIPNPESTRDVIYKVTLNDADPVPFFPTDRRQTIKSTGEGHSALLEVRTAGPETGEAGPATVGEEFLRSNALITSDDRRVIELAARAVGKATDPWAKAQAITRWVGENIKDKNFTTGFASADEVARTLEGDCTEHGVLTAAMCRAEGIPARVVVGMVYAAHLGGFGFHMWDEVYVNGRWVAIDSAFAQSDVDAVHLKLSDTSLDGVAPFETFLSVARVANKLKLEVVEVR